MLLIAYIKAHQPEILKSAMMPDDNRVLHILLF